MKDEEVKETMRRPDPTSVKTGIPLQESGGQLYFYLPRKTADKLGWEKGMTLTLLVAGEDCIEVMTDEKFLKRAGVGVGEPGK